MTPEKKQKADAQSKPPVKSKDIVFTCKFCEQVKPLSEMVVVTRFSPPLVCCKDCEKHAF